MFCLFNRMLKQCIYQVLFGLIVWNTLYDVWGLVFTEWGCIISFYERIECILLNYLYTRKIVLHLKDLAFMCLSAEYRIIFYQHLQSPQKLGLRYFALMMHRSRHPIFWNWRKIVLLNIPGLAAYRWIQTFTKARLFKSNLKLWKLGMNYVRNILLFILSIPWCHFLNIDFTDLNYTVHVFVCIKC